MMKVIKNYPMGVKLLDGKKFQDERGWFRPCLNQDDISQGAQWQINVSMSEFGVIRGLHGQKRPWQQGKLVLVIQGAIQDVVAAVEGPLAGEHVSIRLDSGECRALWVPSGLVHGFQALTQDAMVMYATTGNPYMPSAEFSVRYDDPELGIAWALPPGKVSEKDLSALSLSEAQEILTK